MHIQRETPENHAIRSYTNTEITVGHTVYTKSTLISREAIISPWPITSIQAFNDTHLEALLKLEPEIILIGHEQPGIQIPISVMQNLSKQRIGIECMSIGAASRTFNLLLSEGRKVVIGILFTT